MKVKQKMDALPTELKEDFERKWEAFGQAACEPGVDLDGGDWPVEAGQRGGECSVAGSDLDDRPLRDGHEPCDRGDGQGVSQEVLAVLMSAMSIGRHCLLRGCCGAGHAEKAARP